MELIVFLLMRIVVMIKVLQILLELVVTFKELVK